jgi:Predicted aminopeptidases
MILFLSLLEISQDSIKAHVYFLASEKCEGRFTGSRGERVARDYIKGKLKSYGYKVFEQNFEVLVDLKADRGTFFKVGKDKLELNEDFIPLSFSSEGKVKGEVVFAGWGIEDSLYSDYENLDVKDKIVALFRYSKEDTSNRFERFADIPTKLRIAREKGAKGVIIINPPDHEDELRPLRVREFQSSGIIAVMVTRKAAERILETDIKSLYDSLKLKARPFKTGKTVEIGVKFKRVLAKTANVYAMLEGKRKRWIIFGAHYDHIGWGGPGSGSLKPDTHAIHFGADDNASGVSLVLEASRVMSKERREVGYIFVFFSGEELGLLGSKEFVKNLPVPKESVLVYFNFDMVGRVKDSAFSLFGAQSGERLDSIIDSIAKVKGYRVVHRQGAVGPSDHTSFYLANIPVAFFFTGSHPDYHKPSDTPEKINYQGISGILEIALESAKVIESKGDIKFVKVKEEGGYRGGKLRVKLGIIPSYGSPVEGVLIDGVSPNSVAEMYGIMAGDIIVSIGGKTIKNLYDYMEVMANYKPGDKTVVVVKRSGDILEIPVEFPK